MTKAIRCFSNVTLLPLPPYSPELNPVEQLWQQIKQRFLSNTTFQNYDDIVERSCQTWNEILSEDGFTGNRTLLPNPSFILKPNIDFI
jgi:hypothetical protein